MSKFDLAKTFHNAVTVIRRHSPQILTGVGVGCFFGAIGFAIWGTPKAEERIEERKEELGVEELPPVEVFKMAAPCYIPTVVSALAGTICMCSSTHIQTKQNAALAVAASLSEGALRDYKNKVVEMIGEKKNEDILDAVDEEAVKKNPPPESEVYIEGPGCTLCYDAYFGRYFRSDMDTLSKAESKLNRAMNTGSERYVSVNDFYDELGEPPVECGYDLGWNLDDGLIELRFSSHLANGVTPCLVFTYRTPPEPNYDRF